jgi:hypothetical protein
MNLNIKLLQGDNKKMETYIQMKEDEIAKMQRNMQIESQLVRESADDAIWKEKVDEL